MKSSAASTYKIQKNDSAFSSLDPAAPLAPKRPSRGVRPRWPALLSGLLIAGTLSLAFTQPIAPDTSVYLLHTRTWLERGNRFVDSHDSKGPLMVWLTAPFVALGGANGIGAGLARSGAALATGALIWVLLRRRTPHALPLAAWATALPFAPGLWGDSLRPETYAPALYLAVLWLTLRGTPRAALAAGALAAAAWFLKSLLVLPGLALLAGAILLEWRARRRMPWTLIGAQAAGALGATLLILGVLAGRDSLANWYRQTIEWPAEFRRAETPEAPENAPSLRSRALALYRASDNPRRLELMPLKIGVTLARTGLWPLLGLALLPAFWRGVRQDRERLLALIWLGGQALVLGLEYRRWLYPAAGLLAPLALWFGASPAAGNGRPRALLILGLCSILPLWGWGRETWTRMLGRCRGEPQSSYEALAATLRPLYRPGESLLVLDNNYALHLLLPAPPPPTVLSLHAAMVNAAERETLRRALERNPPDWLISKDPAYTGIRFGGEQPTVRVTSLPNNEVEVRGPYRLIVSASDAWARRRAPDAPAAGLNPHRDSD